MSETMRKHTPRIRTENPPRRILFVGPQWHGSDSAGLARSFRRLGNIVQVVDPDVYFPSGGSSLLKLVRRCFLRLFIKEMNSEILRAARVFQPELLVVFKGGKVVPQTLERLKFMGVYLTLFYPDVSVFCHGPYIPKCMPLYDWIFTAKSFGVGDLRESLGISRAECLLHGYDSDVHHPFSISSGQFESWESDASFIGTWSPRKEAFLAEVASKLQNVRLRIWGTQWERASEKCLQQAIEPGPIYGDLYSLAVLCSRINIGLLSEIREGSSSGDQSTARTFQIPAIGGFMLHERTEEFLTLFREGEEAACFETPAELVEKISHYLNHEEKREEVRLAGHRRCVDAYSLDKRAQRILDHYDALLGSEKTGEGS
jgi:spore maturation protein CgeB